MVDYTWTEDATEQWVVEAKAEAKYFFESTGDYSDVEKLMRAFESIHSKYEADVIFGKEVFRMFQEALDNGY